MDVHEHERLSIITHLDTSYSQRTSLLLLFYIFYFYYIHS